MKKGDSIILPIRGLNVSKDIWGKDADEFKSVYSVIVISPHMLIIFHSPERWENLPEVAKNMPGVWGHVMTFIGGARGCIGYRFALIEYVLPYPILREPNDILI